MSIKRKTVFGRKLPNITITDLRVGQITGTSFELFFTHPNANVTLFEVWIDGVLFDTIDGSGDYVVMLNPATTYSIQVKAVTTDTGTIESNIINETTLSLPYLTTKGMMSMYKLEENTGNTNDVIKNYCLNKINGFTLGTYLSQPAKIGNGYEFTGGNNIIQIPDNDVYSWTEKGIDTPFSMCFWFYAYTTGNNYFLSKRNDEINQAEWQMGWINGELRCGIYGGTIGDLLNINKPVNIGINEWHHLTMSYDGLKTINSLKLYLDGEFISDEGFFTGDWRGAVKTNSDVYLGTDFYPPNNSIEFNGILDELVFYRNRQLTKGEISDIYNHGSGVDLIIPTSASVNAITDLKTKSILNYKITLDFTQPQMNDSAVIYFDVYVDGVLNSQWIGNQNVEAINLNNTTTYNIYVIARDAFGFESQQSNTIQVTTSNSQISTNDLIGWWKLDAPTNQIGEAINIDPVDSYNNYTLTRTNTPTKVDGILNGAFYFNGQGLIANSFSLNDELTFSDGTKDLPFSFSMWIKPNNLSNTNPILMEKTLLSSTNYIEWILYYSTSKNAIQFQIRDENNNTLNIIDSLPNRFTMNNWYYLVVTYDGSQTKEGMKMFINGLEISIQYEINGVYDRMVKTSAKATIAIRHTGNNEFNGAIDDLAIYKRALTPSEINFIYNNGNGRTI